MVTTPQQASQVVTRLPQSELISTRQPVRHQIVIVGGGAGGITVAAQLLKLRDRLDIAIIEPSDQHYYQPGWTLVGGGQFNFADTVRDEATVIPRGVTWIKDQVVTLDPDHNTVITAAGVQVLYDYLVMAPGIQIDWNQIEGLPETLGKTASPVTTPMSILNTPGNCCKLSRGERRSLPTPPHRLSAGARPKKLCTWRMTPLSKRVGSA